MIPPAYVEALRVICERLAESGIDWVVTGSVGLVLQGVEIAVHDIDLQTDAAGAYAIEARFAECVERPVAFAGIERIRSHFGVLRIDGLRVEIMGDVEKRDAAGEWVGAPDLALNRRWVTHAGLSVPVLALEYEREAYTQLGRTATVAAIRRALANRRLNEPVLR